MRFKDLTCNLPWSCSLIQQKYLLYLYLHVLYFLFSSADGWVRERDPPEKQCNRSQWCQVGHSQSEIFFIQKASPCSIISPFPYPVFTSLRLSRLRFGIYIQRFLREVFLWTWTITLFFLQVWISLASILLCHTPPPSCLGTSQSDGLHVPTYL